MKCSSCLSSTCFNQTTTELRQLQIPSPNQGEAHHWIKCLQHLICRHLPRRIWYRRRSWYRRQATGAEGAAATEDEGAAAN